MYRTILLVFAISFLPASLSAQKKISTVERLFILEEIEEEIKTLNRFEFNNPEIFSVFNIQLINAEKILQKYKNYSSDTKVFEKWLELELLYTDNKEIIDFMLPKAASGIYRKAFALLSKGQKDQAYTLFMKALQSNPKHVLSNYQLGKMSMESGKIAEGAIRLFSIVKEMLPSEKEKELIYNFLSEQYNKNYLKAISLSNQGKYAYAMDILTQLDTFCQLDPLFICNKELISKTIIQSKQGIYSDHLKIVDKAIKQNQNNIATDFAIWAYEYFDENRDEIHDTLKFTELVKKIAQKYVDEAKSVEGSRKSAIQEDLLEKAKYLASLVDDNYVKTINSQVSAILPPKTAYAKKIEQIEKEANEQSLSEKFPDYINEEDTVTEKDIEKIERDYINEKTKLTRTESKGGRSVKKELEEKFYETRSFLSVNSFEKALEVLKSANTMAVITTEKKEVEEMYKKAIREITAKRMADAEFHIWQGQQKTADSLIDLTNDLITNYKMQDDTTIIRIMNSYLSVLDKKVCQKKQDEVNGFVFNIMDCIKRADYYRADAYIRSALAIPSSKNCTLDKSKVRALMKQIEKPLEYVNLLDKCYKTLENRDTNGYLLQYGELEDLYYMNDLETMGVNHVPIRAILTANGDVNFALRTIQMLIRGKHYMVALEALGALKDLKYESSATKKIQSRIAEHMSLEMYKMNYTQIESVETVQKYMDDKWFKYFAKDYKKFAKRWEKK